MYTAATNRSRETTPHLGSNCWSQGQRLEVMGLSDAGVVMQSELISSNNILIYLIYIFTPKTK